MRHEQYMAAGPDGLLRLEQPAGLSGEAWRAVTEHLGRLNSAISSGDRPLIVGSCKELAESVARIVLAMRGESAASAEKFPKLVRQAHAALDRQPGKGLAVDPRVRGAAQATITLIDSVGEVRNRIGTGHGRAKPPTVEDETVLVAVDATMLWCRWALRRLAVMIFGMPRNLIDDLDNGVTFYSGDLAGRLAAANLVTLAAEDQAALAKSVARRALSGTFLARIEGIDACAESEDFTAWPMPYRRAMISALMINPQGQIDTAAWAIKRIGLLLAAVDEPVEVLAQLNRDASMAWMSSRMDDHALCQEVQAAMWAEAPRMPSAAGDHWRRIEGRIVEPPF